MKITAARVWISSVSMSFPMENWNQSCNTPRWSFKGSSWGSCVIFVVVNVLWTTKSKVHSPGDSRLCAWLHALPVSSYTFPTETGQELGSCRCATLLLIMLVEVWTLLCWWIFLIDFLKLCILSKAFVRCFSQTQLKQKNLTMRVKSVFMFSIHFGPLVAGTLAVEELFGLLLFSHTC